VAGPSVRLRVGIGAAVVLVVVALVCSVLITALSPVGVTTTLGSDGVSPTASQSDGPEASSPGPSPSSRDGSAADAAADAGASTGAVLLVHVLGAVASPGVYELDESARVFDAVAAAGGFIDQADQASVNLARPLIDGEQLRVLAMGEAPPVAAGDAPGSSGGGSAGGAAAGSAGAAGAGAKVNLNAATELELDGLPRIGPAMAARIIAWRTDNGPFTSVDDLLQVTGIGDKTFEGLRDLVTV
jgi:competence protein ComEA